MDFSWDWLGSAVSDIGDKVLKTLGVLVPAVAVFLFVQWLITDLLGGVQDYVTNKVDSVMATLAVDLNLPTSPYLDQLNVMFPVEESWHYLLLYLATASAMLGIKWFRNLTPGVS